MATMTATVPHTATEKLARRAAFLARAAALGWSQNKLARRAGYKTPGFVSRVLTNVVNAPGVWPRLERTLRKAERARARRNDHAA